MATITDHITDDERYGDEVLNASWLPQEVLRPELDDENARNTSVSASDSGAAAVNDPDSFMQRLYWAQE
jgi:hypothetical protein